MARRITLLGSLVVEDDDRPSPLVQNAKGCALLTYLIATGRPQSREAVADLLWEATSTSQSLRNLRVLLTRIRSYLPGLDVARKTIHYELQPDEVVDYVTLSASLARAGSYSLSELQLYQGELLEGFYLEDAPRFMEWLTLERERLRRAVLDAHRSLCQSLASEKLWQEGADVAAHWLFIDNLDEEAFRWRIQFLAASGQAITALQDFEAYRQLLWDELGAEPEAATQALIEELAKWSGSITAVSLPDLSPLEVLTSGELSEPGSLPANSILPYHRNQDFVGREADLLQIASALGEVSEKDRPPVVAITGIGGLGKTQTAVEFCYRYGRYFPGGVFWLSFAEAENVAEEVAVVGSERGLGLFREAEGLTLADRTGRVQRAWQEPIPRLLIFDNCEDEDLLAAWLPVTGGCRVLLTSRRGLWAPSLGVTAVPLNPLTPSESNRLLQRLAPHLTETEIEEIAQATGHLPLALHLAGGFLHRYRQISPSAYVSQLRDKALLHHPSLQGRGVRYSPTGHELDVARTFALSWEQLDPADEVDGMARQLLACAACLAPGEPIPAEWLKAVVCSDTDDMMMGLLVEDGLSRLVTSGFLAKDKGQTVVLHRLLALFTLEVCSLEEMSEAHTAVGAKMVQTLFDLRQRQGHLATLPFAAAHFRYVSEAAFSRKTRLAASLAALLGFYHEDIGNAVEGERVLKRGCAVAEEIGDFVGQAKILTALAGTQDNMGHFEDALRSAQRAVALFNEADAPEPAGFAEALYFQGWAHYRLGHVEEALSVAEAGSALSEAANLGRTKASCLNLIGVVNYYVLGRYDIAERKLEESLAVYRALGNRRGEAVSLNNMGESARLQGNYAAAVRYYEEALAIAREIENQSRVDLFLSNLCGARIRLGQYDAAAADLEALIAKTQHNWFGLSEAYRFLAEAYLGQGRVAQALAMAQQALAFAYESDPFEDGRAWRVLGLIAARLGQAVPARATDEKLYDARACFERSLSYFSRGDLERDRAITLWYWARYESGQKNEDQAKEMWQEAHETFKRLNLPLLAAAMEKV